MGKSLPDDTSQKVVGPLNVIHFERGAMVVAEVELPQIAARV